MGKKIRNALSLRLPNGAPKFKIARTIVRSDAVLMMNLLIPTQLTSKYARHYDPMFLALLSVKIDPAITGLVYEASAILRNLLEGPKFPAGTEPLIMTVTQATRSNDTTTVINAA